MENIFLSEWLKSTLSWGQQSWPPPKKRRKKTRKEKSYWPPHRQKKAFQDNFISYKLSNVWKVNLKILLLHWCYLKFTAGNNICPTPHICEASLSLESLSHKAEGKLGGSDPAFTELTVSRRWYNLQGTATEAEEKGQNQTSVEEWSLYHVFVRSGNYQRESHF